MTNTALLPLDMTHFLVRKAERHTLIQEALDAVDAGQVITHEDMVAWADSLGIAPFSLTSPAPNHNNDG